MARTDYLDDPMAPHANALVPAASAIVRDATGRILLHRRRDNGLWALPGGTMELGESIGECVAREVREETGLVVEPERIVGIYTNPKHVVAFSDGEVRQEFSVCFVCHITGGELAVSDESFEVEYFSPETLADLPMHASTRLRIAHYLEDRRDSAIC